MLYVVRELRDNKRCSELFKLLLALSSQVKKSWTYYYWTQPWRWSPIHSYESYSVVHETENARPPGGALLHSLHIVQPRQHFSRLLFLLNKGWKYDSETMSEHPINMEDTGSCSVTGYYGGWNKMITVWQVWRNCIRLCGSLDVMNKKAVKAPLVWWKLVNGACRKTASFKPVYHGITTSGDAHGSLKLTLWKKWL